MSAIMAVAAGMASRPTTPGLWRKQYSGYASENVNWFASRTATSSQPITGSISLSVGKAASQGAEWLGYWFAATPGEYQFQYSADSYGYLWIGDQARTGFTAGNAIMTPATQSGSITLAGGLFYPMRVQWSFNQTGDRFLFFDSRDSGFFSFAYSTATQPVTENLSGRIFYNPSSQGF